MSGSSDRFLDGRAAMVTGGGLGHGPGHGARFRGGRRRRGRRLAAVGSLQDGGPMGRSPTFRDGANSTPRPREIEACGGRALAMGLDVTSMESVEAFFDAAVEAFGKVDILANAAGITAEQTIVGHTDVLWQKVLDVNLSGTYRSIKLCLPGMIEREWGRIVNIASTAASVGAPTSGAYCASKAGVVGLSRCVALEGAAHGVTCNTISPTWVETGFGRDWMSGIAEGQEGRPGEAYIADVKSANPQGRLIQPSEIGALALYLCREEAVGVTMQDLTISAGSLW